MKSHLPGREQGGQSYVRAQLCYSCVLVLSGIRLIFLSVAAVYWI